MNKIFAELKNAMVAQLNRNNVVANNLANVNTNGFKRDVMFSEFLANENGNSLSIEIETDYSQGALTSTDNQLDFALSGSGYFTVELDNGKAYTRDGHFNKGADGLLRTTSGHPVMGQSGWIELNRDGLTGSEISINQSGEIFVGNELIDKFEISGFNDDTQLQKIGQNLYKMDDDRNVHVIDEPIIIQGKLETSNVQAIHEMVELIQLQRQFETAQRAIRSIDAANGKAVNSVGRYR